MKKIIYLVTLTTFIISCASTSNNFATKNKKGDLVGVVNKAAFQQEPYGSEWFNDFYSYYETEKTIIEKLKPLLANVTIKGFMGTWCGDSQRDVPNFYKILDEADFNYKNLELIAVNRKKKAKGLQSGFDISHVPTFIFYKNGKEIGRFVEHALEGSTVKEDFLKILSGKEYKHPYQK